MKQNEAGYVDLKTKLDPAVKGLVSNTNKRASVAEKKKQRKEKHHAEARYPKRVNWDLPVPIKKYIQNLAEKERIPQSQLAGYFLLCGIACQGNGQLSYHDFLQSSRSPKYDWNLALDDLISEVLENQK